MRILRFLILAFFLISSNFSSFGQKCFGFLYPQFSSDSIEVQHGYFTYFLLKNLQTNKGQGNLETIISEVSQNVAREAARVGKNQTPNVLPGAEIGEGWKFLGW